MSGLEPILILASTAAAGGGQVMSSNAESAAAEANARQLEMRGKAEQASASVQADRKRKEADALISKQRAIAAASGGGTGGSAAEIMGETAAQGQYSSDLEMWLGSEKRSGDQYAAQIARMEAKAKRKALPFQVGSAVLSGASRAYYGRTPADRREAASSDYSYG
mgnify:CR=1 FL=1